MSEELRVRVTVEGQVQGVGYRFFVQEHAESLGVRGWVRNLFDGRVEAELEGEASAVRQLLDYMRRGPSMSHVEKLSQFPLLGSRQYDKFRVAASGN